MTRSERNGRRTPWRHRVMAERRAAAEARQAQRAARGDEGQLARLDALLGEGVGARRERARLAARLVAKRGGKAA